MAPMDFYHKLVHFGRQEAVPASPAILPRTAALLSVLYTFIYVAPFYLDKSTRTSSTLSRNAPSLIRARIRAVTFACITCALITVFVLQNYGHHDFYTSLHLLGWYPFSFSDIGKVILLVAILFAGPLLEKTIFESEWEEWITFSYWSYTLGSLPGIRDLIAGPVSEELLFRSVLIPLHLLSFPVPETPPPNTPPSSYPHLTTLIFITPLYFGIAHLHHLHEFRISHPNVHLAMALLRSVVQFTYTTLFGWFAAFVFLRTGSVWAAMAAHGFCNWLGLPRFWGRVGVRLVEQQRFSGVDAVPDVGGADATEVKRRYEGKGKKQGEEVRFQDQSWHAGWTLVYYGVLAAGAYGFYVFLFPLTESKWRIVEF
ncbi:CaaX prenyl proteinase Rce1 [Aulographum hederae CBS 113979]|uniref:intramembrane prenyl-peptidase Rce1 n=1 Tax=Aulographum hederae CBS 113979 TaxID=1176131 RepID=A0A6G1HBQ9_9PEZI|nr:CaaX prenyl proteinase Rce1 [Aulographum hederae CBS 113979]